MIFKNNFTLFTLYLAFLLELGLGLTIDRQSQGLSSVPQDLDVLVTDLILKKNNILQITGASFALYTELRLIDLTKNGLTHILDGAFDNNAKLEKLIATGNDIIQLPQSFGAAKGSLTYLMLWAALHPSVITKLNFTELTKLGLLNIGDSDYRGGFDAALLPRNLGSFCINVGKVQAFLDFASHTPMIRIIKISTNEITYIPEKYVSGLSMLTKLSLAKNKLQSLPDLHHLPLNELSLKSNPLECNYCLCWVRMSHWLNPSLLKDEPTCDSPTSLQGILLMEIHPVKLGCRDGMCTRVGLKKSNTRLIYI